MTTAELSRPEPSAVRHAPTTRWPLVSAVLVAMGLAMAAGLVVGGELGRFSQMGLVFAPAIVLVGLLQQQGRPWVRSLSWAWFWLLLSGFAALVAGVTLVADGGEPDPARAGVVFGVVLCVVFVAVALAATLGVWLGGRLEHGRASHAQGTIGLLIGSALAFAPLVLLGGKAPLSALLGDPEADLVGGAMAQAAEQLYMLAWAAVFAMWAAAWPTHVSFSGALQRLGLGPIARRDVPWIAGLTLLAVGIGFAGDFVTGALIDALGWPRTDAELLERLLPAAKVPLGALIIAVGAGVSEELVVRGLLQPRFGWLPANLAFVSAHAFQYGVDGLLVVFMGGALLAFVRWRWNTTAAIAVHTGYDLILLGIGLVGG